MKKSCALALGIMGIAGCQSEASEPASAGGMCTDADGDGRGVGTNCPIPPDCDDSNPSLGEEADCASACESEPQRDGCPCDEMILSQAPCYSGSAGTRGVGRCRDGRRTCSEGAWSACEGQVLPVTEVCNGIDDDCDGTRDDHLSNSCGECAPEDNCFHLGGELPFELGASTDVVLDEARCLTLAPGATSGTWWATISSEGFDSFWSWLETDAHGSGPGPFLAIDARSAADSGALEAAPMEFVCEPRDGTTRCADLPFDGELLQLRATLTATDSVPTLCAVRVASEPWYAE